LTRTGETDFARLWEEHAGPLFAYVTYRTHDRALAEDIVADTFERALRGRSRFDFRRGSARTWIYAIARNCLTDHGRRNGAEERALERVHAGMNGDGPDEASRLAERDLVMRALAGLSPDERDVIALRYGADLTAPEIAELVGEPRTTVEGRLYRGLRRLRADLAAPTTA
jgi:RNA polymerase sigma-70 factor (ECF subfamily)